MIRAPGLVFRREYGGFNYDPNQPAIVPDGFFECRSEVPPRRKELPQLARLEARGCGTISSTGAVVMEFKLYLRFLIFEMGDNYNHVY